MKLFDHQPVIPESPGLVYGRTDRLLLLEWHVVLLKLYINIIELHCLN